MKFTEQHIAGVWVIEPKVYKDARGYFSEVYKQELFEQHIAPVCFVQDNESKSSRGVLRGLHFQKGDFSQAKLVRVIQGRVLDVAVDMRRNSAYFGQYVAVELSDENKKQFFIPRNFAHGFLVLSPEAVFTYKVDNVYAPQEEGSVNYADPKLGISWPIPAEELILSPKDAQAPMLKQAYTFPGLLL